MREEEEEEEGKEWGETEKWMWMVRTGFQGDAQGLCVVKSKSTCRLSSERYGHRRRSSLQDITFTVASKHTKFCSLSASLPFPFSLPFSFPLFLPPPLFLLHLPSPFSLLSYPPPSPSSPPLPPSPTGEGT